MKKDSLGRTLACLVPDFRPLYEAVCEFVSKHQGEKGYIDTQDKDCDMILGLTYDEGKHEAQEILIHGIRVNPENGSLQIVYEYDVSGYHNPIIYDDEAFRSPETEWHDVWDDEYVYLNPTLVNIAENLEGYVKKLRSGNAPKKKYRVSIHWSVAYNDIVEATDEDEAYETVKERMSSAPSSDFEWLEQTEYDVNEYKD